MTLKQRRGTGIACIPNEDDFEKVEVLPDFKMDEELRSRIHRKVWRTKTGIEKPIKLMSRFHLIRTINLIKRKAHHEHPATKEYIRLMQLELHRRDPDAYSAPT